jgi:cytochrome c-type biogenesis protein CcmE
MKPKVLRRLGLTLLMGGIFGLTLYGIVDHFRDNLVFFFSPTEMRAAPEKARKQARLGGLIKKGSVQVLSQKDHILQFILTDYETEMVVEYSGFLPDLFREGQGLVAEGIYDPKSQVFKARTVLAKHDATYRPPDMTQDKHKALEGTGTSLIPVGNP